MTKTKRNGRRGHEITVELNGSQVCISADIRRPALKGKAKAIRDQYRDETDTLTLIAKGHSNLEYMQIGLTAGILLVSILILVAAIL